MQVLVKEKQTKEVEVVIENHYLCDKCNKKIRNQMYDAFDFELSYKTGESYPEGGMGKVQELDLCDVCAKEFIVLLKTNGYRVNTKEWDH